MIIGCINIQYNPQNDTYDMSIFQDVSSNLMNNIPYCAEKHEGMNQNNDVEKQNNDMIHVVNLSIQQLNNDVLEVLEKRFKFLNLSKKDSSGGYHFLH